MPSDRNPAMLFELLLSLPVEFMLTDLEYVDNLLADCFLTCCF